MMGLPTVMWVFVALFGIIGAMRGWAKEILVAFSMLLGLFIVTIVDTYVGGVFSAQSREWQFFIRASFIIVMAFFGYPTPSFPPLGSKLPVRDKLQDWLLGLFLGMINGYFIAGTLWFFLHTADYPTRPFVLPPAPDDEYILGYMKYLPPEILKVPYIYFAVGVSFLFVIIVFV